MLDIKTSLTESQISQLECVITLRIYKIKELFSPSTLQIWKSIWITGLKGDICFVSSALECEECRGTLICCEPQAAVAPLKHRLLCDSGEHWRGQGIVTGAGRSHHICQRIKVAALLWSDTQAKIKENRKSHSIFNLGLNVASWENRWLLKSSRSLSAAFCSYAICRVASLLLHAAVCMSSWVTNLA